MPKPSNIVMSQKLPDVPGKTLTALLVQYEPGGKTPKHHHPGSVMAFVVSGAIRSQTQPPARRGSTARVKRSSSRRAGSIS
jgi:quercetin dioxygenase-like cupin family protein